MSNNFKSQLNTWATQHNQGFASAFTLTFDSCSSGEYEAELVYRPTGQTTSGGTTRGKRETEQNACEAMLALLEGDDDGCNHPECNNKPAADCKYSMCAGCCHSLNCTRHSRQPKNIPKNQPRKSRKGRASPPKVHTHRPPFDSASGVWVPATEFGGTKSFGRFACAGCNKSWGSAHAYPQFRQGCQACNLETKPCCMWVNDSDNRSDRDTDSDEDKAPHDEERCEACRLGVCDMARRDF